MLPEVSKDELQKALEAFDRDLRPSENWKEWDSKGSYRYAIEHDGRLYPAKTVLSLAAGVPVTSFSGGLQGANKIFERHGFKIVPLNHSASTSVDDRRVYWVNQGRSYDQESTGRYIWAPHRDRAGAQRSYHKRLAELKVGDIVIHYSEGAIRAISRVVEPAKETPRPHRPREGAEQWQSDGLQVGLEYFELGDRAVTSDRVALMFHGLQLDDGPFQENEAVKVGYLWQFNREGLSRLRSAVGNPWPDWAEFRDEDVGGEIDVRENLGQLVAYVAGRGFVFEPWQIAAFITAVRTKPFVILAGVTGTGKSQLPMLVADGTGGVARVIPVRPDWTDSSDVLGYLDLQGSFRAGQMLEYAEQAANDPGRFYFCIVDEMNLARVEHYFAEVLSRIEGRAPVASGGFASPPLLSLGLKDERWSKVGLPPNLAIVGTVNMDESAHGFSRKVLDRAFTLELSDVDLAKWAMAADGGVASRWPASAWFPRATQLGSFGNVNDGERATVDRVITLLTEANAILRQAQLQVGYRTRDEIALFALNAEEVRDLFITADGDQVDPIDLALQMKLLPRIAGGSAPIRRVLLGLLGFATTGAALEHERDAQKTIEAWNASSRASALADARFPRTGARLCLMWDRMVTEGFTSFWL